MSYYMYTYIRVEWHICEYLLIVTYHKMCSFLFLFSNHTSHWCRLVFCTWALSPNHKHMAYSFAKVRVCMVLPRTVGIPALLVWDEIITNWFWRFWLEILSNLHFTRYSQIKVIIIFCYLCINGLLNAFIWEFFLLKSVASFRIKLSQ